MNEKVKKIIAREGLIIIGFVFIFILFYWTGTHTQIQWEQYRKEPKPNQLLISWANGTLGYYVALIGYPIYLIVRFIIWAIRTLKQRK